MSLQSGPTLADPVIPANKEFQTEPHEFGLYRDPGALYFHLLTRKKWIERRSGMLAIIYTLVYNGWSFSMVELGLNFEPLKAKPGALLIGASEGAWAQIIQDSTWINDYLVRDTYISLAI